MKLRFSTSLKDFSNFRTQCTTKEILSLKIVRVQSLFTHFLNSAAFKPTDMDICPVGLGTMSPIYIRLSKYLSYSPRSNSHPKIFLQPPRIKCGTSAQSAWFSVLSHPGWAEVPHLSLGVYRGITFRD